MPRLAVLRADPELVAGLGADQALEAQSRCAAEQLTIDRKTWVRDAAERPEGRGLVLILDGYALRRITHSGEHGVEFLGPGDIVAVGKPAESRTMSEVTVALLDRHFFQQAAAWPEIGLNVAGRIADRAQALTVVLALVHVQRLSDRLHLMLWALAERWGRMTQDGVWLPFSLTQQDLADLVGARRPSVTLAMRALTLNGSVFRVPDSGRLIIRMPSKMDGSASAVSDSRLAQQLSDRPPGHGAKAGRPSRLPRR